MVAMPGLRLINVLCSGFLFLTRLATYAETSLSCYRELL